MELRKSLSIAAALIAFSLLSAQAGSLSINPGQPSFSGNFLSNSITAQVANGNLLEVFGDASIAITPGGSASISVSGNFSADTGDFVSFFYNFGINLSSAVPVSFTLQATANTQLGPVTVSSNGVVMPGNHQYSDMGQSPAAPISLSGTYTASLTFDFGSVTKPSRYGVNGADFLALSIPNQGLAFEVGTEAVPEPSTYACVALGLGMLLLLARRRVA